MTTPTLDNVFLKPYELPAESEGGIIIPEAFRKDRTKMLYEVVDVGPGYRTRKGIIVESELIVGDVIEVDNPFAVQLLDKHEPDVYVTSERNIKFIHEWRVE